MDKKEHLGKLAKLVKEAHEALIRAELYADEHDLDFFFGPARGMGGWYTGKNTAERKEQDNDNNSDNGWVSSSSGC